MTLTIKSTRFQNDVEILSGTESEIINIFRDRFSDNIPVISFRIGLKNGQKEWFGFNYGIEENLIIS